MKNSHTYPFINALLSAWKATGKPMGIDAYLRITQLVEALPDDTNLEDLKVLLAPIIVGSPQQQADFYETFARVLKNFDTSPPPTPPSVFSWKKALKWLGLALAAAMMTWLLWLLYQQFFSPKPAEKPTPIFIRVIDIDTDAAGQKDKMSEFLGLQFQTPPLSVKSFERSNQKETSKSGIFIGKHLFLDIDSVAQTLFYKPVSVGDDTFHFKFCLSNDSCYEQIHVFAVQKNVRSGSTGGGWGDKIDLKPYKHEPDIATLKAENKTTFNFQNAYLSGWKWLILGLIAILLGIIYSMLKLLEGRREKEKQDAEDAAKLDRKPNTAPPFIWQLQIPNVEKVNFDAVFARMTTQLRRRSEIEHLIFDPKRTIKATIAKGGLATFRYRQPTRADEYLFLIDVHNANDHRAQVFDLLYRTLLKNEVLIERFFYDGDLRLCWNEAHRQGIRLNELAQRFGSSRLVVVGLAASLMNPTVNELMAWTSVFDNWRQRVLLTPRSPLEWNAMERVLATKFRILPANMRGLEAMPDTFDALDAPDFRKWRTVKDPDFEPIRLPDVLNEEAIMAHLEMVFMVYKNGKTDNRLLLWLAACAVPPVLHWDTTLFFGNLIADLDGKKGDEAGLVNLDNLFKINRLSWFLEGKLLDTARRALLKFLETKYPSVYQEVRAAWDTVLHENLAAARKAAAERGEDFDKSVAFDDLRLQMIVNELKRGVEDADKRQALLTELRGLTRGGGRGDIVALEILEKELNTVSKNLDDIKRALHERIDKDDVDGVINELLTLTKAQTALQTRLKELKLAMRK